MASRNGTKQVPRFEAVSIRPNKATTGKNSGPTEDLDQVIHNRLHRLGMRIVDEPGEFQMINKNDLQFDLDYQRDNTPARVRAIGKNWSWFACGALRIAQRADGTLYVFDGGHRAQAAMDRGDIQALPCMVYQTEDSAEEAQAFLRANTFRKAVRATDKFRAMVITKDPAALLVSNLTTNSGLKISKNGRNRKSFQCVASLLKHANQHPDLLMKCWPLLAELAEERALTSTVTDGLLYIEKHLEGTDVSLTRAPWRSRVLKLGIEGLMEAAGRGAAFYARGGARAWGLGIIRALNKGMKNRLSIGVDEDDEGDE